MIFFNFWSFNFWSLSIHVLFNSLHLVINNFYDGFNIFFAFAFNDIINFYHFLLYFRKSIYDFWVYVAVI